MAYTKQPIGGILELGALGEQYKALKAIADIVNANLAAIETAIGQDSVLGFGTEPGAVSSSTSGQAGTATTASRADHNHDLGAHLHSGDTDGGALTGYQAKISDTMTLTQLGLTIPVYSGKLATVTGASTLLELLAAIDAIV